MFHIVFWRTKDECNSNTFLGNGHNEGDHIEWVDVVAEVQPERRQAEQEVAPHGHVTSAKGVGQEASGQSSQLEQTFWWEPVSEGRLDTAGY